MYHMLMSFPRKFAENFPNPELFAASNRHVSNRRTRKYPETGKFCRVEVTRCGERDENYYHYYHRPSGVHVHYSDTRRNGEIRNGPRYR